MRRRVLAVIGALALGVSTGGAAAPAPKAGVDYLVLPERQHTGSGNKVEVTEFFAYSCPHCHSFEPKLAAWVAKQGPNIVYRRVHVGLNGGVGAQQRLFYTLEAMGLLEQYHARVFAAIHEQRLRLNSDELVFAWAEQAGIARARFIETYRSSAVQASINGAAGQMQGYRIEYWPVVAVGGRYLTSPYQASQGGEAGATEAQQQQAALEVLDHLVAKAAAESP